MKSTWLGWTLLTNHRAFRMRFSEECDGAHNLQALGAAGSAACGRTSQGRVPPANYGEVFVLPMACSQPGGTQWLLSAPENLLQSHPLEGRSNERKFVFLLPGQDLTSWSHVFLQIAKRRENWDAHIHTIHVSTNSPISSSYICISHSSALLTLCLLQIAAFIDSEGYQ